MAAKEKKPAQKKLKGKLPSKRTLNLVYKEKDTGRRVFILLAIILFILVIAGFAWFFVRGQLSKVGKSRNEYESRQRELHELEEVKESFEGIEEKYSHYGISYMNADELALQNRLDILGVINKRISLAQGMSSIQLSGNTATVQLMSLELKEVSDIVAALEESDIVSFVGVNTAAMDRQGSLARKNQSLVQATITIEFKPGAGQVMKTGGDGEQLTDKLAARKAAMESLGEE